MGTAVSLTRDEAREVCDDELVALARELSLVVRCATATLGIVAGELDRRGVIESQFGRRCASWLGLELGVSRASVRKVMAVSRACEPVVSGLEAGVISHEHASVLTEVTNESNRSVMELASGVLVDAATEMPFSSWTRLVRDTAAHFNQDGNFRPEPESWLSLVPVGESVVVKGELHGDHGRVVSAAIEGLADELFRRGGEIDPPPSRSELRAHALAELVQRSSRTATSAVLVVETAGTSVATRTGALRFDEADRHQLLCEASVAALVVDSTGEPLFLGRSQRRVSAPQRRAIAVRDGGCVFPGCDAALEHCDVHHVVAFSEGGATDVDQMAMLCRFHHGISHRPDWMMTHTTGQAARFRWVTPHGEILHSQRHFGAIPKPNELESEERPALAVPG